MKILHAPFHAHPDPAGGTEVYVESLCKGLQHRGIDTLIVAPAAQDATCSHQGIRIRRFATSPHPSLRTLYGEGDPIANQSFCKILDDERPDIVHLHSHTSAIAAQTTREIKRRKIPIVFTYHTETTTCQRGDLLRWGKEICDGRMDEKVCTACTLQSLGVPKIAAEAWTGISRPLQGLLRKPDLSGGVWTGLRIPELMALRLQSTREFLENADRIVVTCHWAEKLLHLNHIPGSKIVFHRQGISLSNFQETPVARTLSPSRGTPLKGIFLGRLHPVKGIHVVLEALRKHPNLPIRLEIYGTQDADQALYRKKLAALSKGDSRIIFSPPLAPENVASVLRQCDFLVVPSQWLETGPLVVLEAQAAGVPVIGSRLGGIAELVNDEVDGLLVDFASPESWDHVFERLCHEKSLLDRLRGGIRPPKNMESVVEEMLILYRGLNERP